MEIVHMRTRKIALGLTLVTAWACLGASAVARTEPGSFLETPVATTADLVREVQTDARVRSRFMRHFGMTQNQLVAYFKTLAPGRLPSNGLFVVFNVHADEAIRSRLFRLKKGTRVFFDRHMKPILKFSCANPMVLGSNAGSMTPAATTR